MSVSTERPRLTCRTQALAALGCATGRWQSGQSRRRPVVRRAGSARQTRIGAASAAGKLAPRRPSDFSSSLILPTTFSLVIRLRYALICFDERLQACACICTSLCLRAPVLYTLACKHSAAQRTGDPGEQVMQYLKSAHRASAAAGSDLCARINFSGAKFSEQVANL